MRNFFLTKSNLKSRAHQTISKIRVKRICKKERSIEKQNYWDSYKINSWKLINKIVLLLTINSYKSSLVLKKKKLR
jgi:hypothetical protein